MIDEKTRQLLEQRDPVFLAALFTEINPFLMRMCGTNGIYKSDAEEVIHNTWEAFFANLEKFAGRSQIRTFICGILFNKIREHRRSAGKAIYVEDAEEIFKNSFTADGWWNTEPDDPHRLLELKRAGQFIEDCLESLSEQQRAAFVLREVEDEDAADICRTLAVEISHLRVLLFRAKDKLRKCLEGKVAAEVR